MRSRTLPATVVLLAVLTGCGRAAPAAEVQIVDSTITGTPTASVPASFSPSPMDAWVASIAAPNRAMAALQEAMNAGKAHEIQVAARDAVPVEMVYLSDLARIDWPASVTGVDRLEGATGDLQVALQDLRDAETPSQGWTAVGVVLVRVRAQASAAAVVRAQLQSAGA